MILEGDENNELINKLGVDRPIITSMNAKLPKIQLTSTKLNKLGDFPQGGGSYREMLSGGFVIVEHINSTRRKSGKDPLMIGNLNYSQTKIWVPVPERGKIGVLGDVILSRTKAESLGQIAIKVKLNDQDYLDLKRCLIGVIAVGGMYGQPYKFDQDGNCMIDKLAPGSYKLLLPDFDMIKSRWDVTVKPGNRTQLTFTAASQKVVKLNKVSYEKKLDTNYGKGVAASGNSEYLIKPIDAAKTDLQKTFASSQKGVDVLLDGTAILTSDGMVSGNALSLVQLRKELQLYTDRKKRILNIHIYLTLGSDGMADDILRWSFEGFGRDTGFRKTKVFSHYQGEGFVFADLLKTQKKLLLITDEGDEPVSGNKLVKVYPVRTSLSRAKFDSADCVVEIIPRFEKWPMKSIPPEIDKAIRKYVSSIKVKQKNKLFIKVTSKGEGRKAVDWFVNHGKEELTKDLGYELIVVHHTPQ